MLLLRAIIRPEKVKEVLDALLEAGHSSVTKMEVYGRGKQNGIQIGDVFYDEIPKEMILMIIDDEDKEEVKPIKGKNNKGLYELRIKFSKDAARIFYFTHYDNKYVLLNGFIKKVMKTPRKEIARALRYM